MAAIEQSKKYLTGVVIAMRKLKRSCLRLKKEKTCEDLMMSQSTLNDTVCSQNERLTFNQIVTESILECYLKSLLSKRAPVRKCITVIEV